MRLPAVGRDGAFAHVFALQLCKECYELGDRDDGAADDDARLPPAEAAAAAAGAIELESVGLRAIVLVRGRTLWVGVRGTINGANAAVDAAVSVPRARGAAVQARDLAARGRGALSFSRALASATIAAH